MTPRQIHVRPADESDAPAIAFCLSKAFAPYEREYTSGAYADTVLPAAAVCVRMKHMRIVVAMVDNKVVGTVAGALAPGMGVDQEGHLRGMAVLPEWHGLGVAVALLVSIENWLTSRGCRRITLDTTLPLKSAMKFYEKNGYRRTGRVTDFFGMELIEYLKTS